MKLCFASSPPPSCWLGGLPKKKEKKEKLFLLFSFSLLFLLEIKCIIHAVVNSLCGLRSCLSCGTCTTFVCCTDTLRIQAITAEEVESRFASEWETDHPPLS